MIAELSRREKAANIKPDPDIDIFMKVWKELFSITKSSLGMYGTYIPIHLYIT